MRVLYIGDKKLPIARAISFHVEEAFFSEIVDIHEGEFIQKNQNAFDIVVLMLVLEKVQNPVGELCVLQSLVNSTGRLLVGVNNALGARFFCGEEDPYTGTRFDCLTEYIRLSSWDKKHMAGHVYTNAQMLRFLKESGFKKIKRYAVYPCLEEPQLMYADGILPEEDFSIRYFPKYKNIDGLFFEEQYFVEELIDNGLFHELANAFIFECTNAECLDVEHVTISGDRSKEIACATVISSKMVYKLPLYQEGSSHIDMLYQNMMRIEKVGIPTVRLDYAGKILCMPRIREELGDVYLTGLLCENTDKFYEMMDLFWEMILGASPVIEEDAQLGPIQERGYTDMVPLNAFVVDGKFVFFDQEFVKENYPAKAILYRSIQCVYWGHMYDENVPAFDDVLKRYGLYDAKETFERMSADFSEDIIIDGKSNLQKPEFERIRDNRQNFAYSNRTFRKMFDDIFGEMEGKEIYVFGAGKWGEYFIKTYGEKIPIAGILDNNEKLWGSECLGIRIYAPVILCEKDPGKYKVLICVREYFYILEQIKIYGASNIGIYDKRRVYPEYSL